MDWKKNRLPLAALAFVTMIALAVLASRSEYTGDTSELPSLPSIDTDAVTEVIITRPDPGVSVRLLKNEGVWTLAEPLEAATDQSAISALLARLAELDVKRVAASRSENHERLGVDDAHGIRLVVRAGDEEVVELLVGTSREQTTMVRLPGEDAVLAVQGALRYSIDRDVKDWREKTIIALDPSTVQTLAFQSESGAFRFARDAEGEWTQAEDEAAIEGFDPSRVDAMTRALVQLRASDFARPEATPAELGLREPHASVTFTTRPASGADEGSPAPLVDETHIVRVGNTRGERTRFVEVEGDDVRYVVTTFSTDKFSPDAEAFVAPPPGSAPPGGMPGMGMPGMPGMGMPGGQGQIPPEILRQIQQPMGQAPH